MSISGHSSTRMLECYTHPTLERHIAALDTFKVSTKCPQNAVQEKEAAEAASFAKNFGLPSRSSRRDRRGPPSPRLRLATSACDRERRLACQPKLASNLERPAFALCATAGSLRM